MPYYFPLVLEANEDGVRVTADNKNKRLNNMKINEISKYMFEP